MSKRIRDDHGEYETKEKEQEKKVKVQYLQRQRQIKTVPMSINSVITNKKVTETIDETVHLISRWCFHATLFLDFYIRYCIQNNIEPTLPGMSKEKEKKSYRESVVRSIMTKVLLRNRKERAATKIVLNHIDEVRKAWYAMLKDLNIQSPKIPSGVKLTNVITYVTKQYESTLWEVFDSEDVVKSHVKAFEKRPGHVKTPTLYRRVNDIMTDKESLITSKNRFDIAKWRLNMLDAIEEVSTDIREGKTFDIVPHAKSFRSFITIDSEFASSDCFKGLIDTPKEDETWVMKLFPNLSEHTPKGFCIPKTVKTDGIQIQIPYEKEILVEKTMSVKESEAHLWNRKDGKLVICNRDNVKIPSYPSVDDSTWNPEYFNNGRHKGLYSLREVKKLIKKNNIDVKKDVVSIDPGETNTICSYIPKTNTYFTMSKNTYLALIKSKQSRTRSNKAYSRMKKKDLRNRGWKHPEVQRAESEMSKTSTKTSHFELFCEAVKVRLSNLDTMFKFYGTRKQARLRFHRSILQQHTLDWIVNKVAPSPETIVAYGSGYNGSKETLKGITNGPGPVKKIRRHFAKKRKTVLTDEFHTSKKCSVCGCVGENPKRFQRYPLTKRHALEKDHPDMKCKGRLNSILGEFHCIQCRKSKNRDNNAAFNIYQAFQHEVTFGKRPKYLQRPKTSKKRKQTVDAVTTLGQSKNSCPHDSNTDFSMSPRGRQVTELTGVMAFFKPRVRASSQLIS